MRRICIVPRVEGTSGMASFRHKFESGLAQRGIEVSHDPGEKVDALLVIGGTREAARLWRARRRGTRLVHRLDGINWMHRVRPTPLRLWLRSELANLLLALIRRMADRVVYQSAFVSDWWQRGFGPAPAAGTVIYNGVDLGSYTPAGPERPPSDRVRVLVVEGSLADSQEAGLPWALDFARALGERLNSPERSPKRAVEALWPVELVIAARVSAAQQAYWTENAPLPVKFLGVIPREQIPALDRSAHLYFSAEVNPPCPNSVIEALACGLPVAGFAMGALPELITPQAGCLVEYGGDPWNLESPDIPALANAATKVLEELPGYQAGARARAESVFGLDQMVERYLDVLLG
jgi:glycosyltransferase involved in cell wall biosynthesis